MRTKESCEILIKAIVFRLVGSNFLYLSRVCVCVCVRACANGKHFYAPPCSDTHMP